jgi:hypothetical protein
MVSVTWFRCLKRREKERKGEKRREKEGKGEKRSEKGKATWGGVPPRGGYMM